MSAERALKQAVNSHPTSKGVDTQLKDIAKRLPLRVLSTADWQHWVTNGYVIVRKVVPAANVERLVDVLWDFDEKDPDDPSTWHAPQRREHKMKELNNTGMLEIYNHQYLWDNRQEQRVYDVFVDIWDREDLWVTIDRANLNPPKKVQGNPNGFIHWDVDTSIRPPPIGVQGVLSLKKQDGDVGGFQCIPELFSNFDAWVKTQPADRDPMHPDTSGLRDRQCRDGGRRPADLQHPARTRRAAQPFGQPGSHGAIHLHAPGRAGQRDGAAGANPSVARARSSAARRLSRRSARLGEAACHDRETVAARRKAARPEAMALIGRSQP